MTRGLAAAWILVLALAAGCGTTHTVRPLGQGNHGLHVSLGGPVAGIGKPSLFVPFVTATYKYGVTDTVDVYAGWHVLETFINGGNAFFDVGASWYFLRQRGARPGISTALTLSPLLNRQAAWAMVDWNVSVSWALGPKERHLLYLGWDTALFAGRKTYIPTPPISWSPFVGAQLRVGRNRALGLGLEVKWHQPYRNSDDLVVGYVGPGKQGALAFLGGVSVYLDKPKGRGTKRAPPPAAADPAPGGGAP